MNEPPEHSRSRACLACALPRESKALRPLLEDWAVDLITTGLGRKRTRSSLQQRFSTRIPSLFVFTGIAGALSPDLSMGQVVFPEKWILQNAQSFSVDRDLTRRLKSLDWRIAGSGLTVRRPVLRSQTRERLHRQTGALICDMEAAHALALALEFEVPTLALKVVSDTRESSLSEFWRHLDSNLERLQCELQRLFHDLKIPRRDRA